MRTTRTARGPHQLPPGRHGLARSFVARNQRERILAAVAQSSSEHGYAGMSVQDVVAVAGVSRRTFYEQFRNKDDAFIAAFDEAAGRLMRGVEDAYVRESRFVSRVSAGFEAFLEMLAASPAFAQMCIVEVMAAGPKAVERRNRTLARFAAMLEDNAQEYLGDDAPSPLVAETTVGGVYEVVYRRIAEGRIDELPSLLPDLVEPTLGLYVGEEEAAAHARSLRRRRREVEPDRDGLEVGLSAVLDIP